MKTICSNKSKTNKMLGTYSNKFTIGPILHFGNFFSCHRLSIPIFVNGKITNKS